MYTGVLVFLIGNSQSHFILEHPVCSELYFSSTLYDPVVVDTLTYNVCIGFTKPLHNNVHTVHITVSQATIGPKVLSLE